MNYKKIMGIAAAFLVAGAQTFAQTPGGGLQQNEYRTVTSGIWDDPNGSATTYVWEYYKNSTSGWIGRGKPDGPDKGIPRVQVKYDLIFGYTHKSPQTIPRTIIYAGASVKSSGDSLRTIKCFADSLWVDGNFGGAGNDGWLDFVLYRGSENMTQYLNGKSTLIGGSGGINLFNFRVGVSDLSTFAFMDTTIIDQNMTISNGIFSAYYNSAGNTALDNINVNLLAGRKIIVKDTASFHSRSANTLNAAGIMNYNIFGTLDMSAATGSSNIVPNSVTATSVITMNVNGLVKLGASFNSVNATPSATMGSVKLNINAGGSVEAIATKVPNAQFKFSTWITNGGMLRRVVGTTDTAFPVKTPTSAINSVVINSTTKDTFSVAVRDGFTVTWAAPTSLVNKEWHIVNSTNGVAHTNIQVMWTTADQGSGFNAANGLSAYVYNGTTWVEKTATVLGTGVATDPYVATIQALDTCQYIVIGSKALVVPVGSVGVKNIGINPGSVTIAPNPVTNNQIALGISELPSGKYKVAIYNAIGQLVSTQTINHQKGNSAYSISLPDGIAKGIYQVNISNSATQITKKISVQ